MKLKFGMVGAAGCLALALGAAEAPPGVRAEGAPREIFRENFETTRCGLLPRRVNSANNAVTTNELCRYVSNVDPFEGMKSLICDFTQLEAGSRGAPAKAHGWLSWWGDDKIRDGWIVYRVALKRGCGALSGEIRSHYRFRKGDKPRWWISQWITVDDEYRIRIESTHRSVSLGKVPQGRWFEVELWLPTPDNSQPKMWGRLVYDRGRRPGAWVAIDLNGMIMASGYNLMQYGGAGKAKWQIDDIRVLHAR